MNFEATDRLPIMANGVSTPFVLTFLNITEEAYWADQPAAHYETMRRLGQDFHIQQWFPPRETAQWAPGADRQWEDERNVAADMEVQAAELNAGAAGIRKDFEDRVRQIMDYQAATQSKMGGDLLWIFGMDWHGAHIVCLPYGTYGYEGLFLVAAVCPEVLGEHLAAQGEAARAHNEAVVEAARRLDWPRIAYCGDDVTTQRGNMLNPALMDRIYFPPLDRALEPLVQAGFKIIWHSDGNMNDMLRPLIDIGVAGFQGFQEECGTRIAEVAKLRNRNGDPLILWGSCSVIDVVRNGTAQDIRNEVQRVIAEWPHRGLCLATSSYLSEDVPYDNIITFYQCCRELGRTTSKDATQ